MATTEVKEKMKNTFRNKYPLRKVMQRVIGKPWRVILECGHETNASTDIYGETCPVRQRCRQCYELSK
jgi:hypothetical protein